MPQKLILVDDIVDSKWTITVCGFLLIEKGCGEVYPFALADSSMQEEDNGN
jgi:ATP-dependent DNA helicase RecQ